MGDVVNKPERFQQSNPLVQCDWVVTIEVTVGWKFIKAVLEAWVRRRPLRIRHTFVNKPLPLERKDL